MHEDQPVQVVTSGPGWHGAAPSQGKAASQRPSPTRTCGILQYTSYTFPRMIGPAAAISLMLLLLTSYLSYTRITIYRTEAEQLRLLLEQRTQQLAHKTQQLEQRRKEVLTSHQQDLLARLPAVQDLDRAAAVTSPIGQQLVNLAQAAQHFDQIQARMAPILAYTHSLPVPDLARSNVFNGNAARLRRVVRDLLAGGREVRVGVVGGSISCGHGTSHPKNSTYFAQVDLLFVDFTLNDGFEDVVASNSRVRVMERLLRKALAQPHAPAVVLMQVLTQHAGYDGTDWRPGHRPPHITLEDLYGAVAQHYDQPWLSMRAGMWRYVVAPAGSEVTDPGNSSTWSFHSFYPGIQDVHPNDLGHKLMADMAVHLVQRTAFELLASRPWGAADELELVAGLPEPMYPGNYELGSRMCAHNEALKAYAVSAQGWAFRAEGRDAFKPKYGYVATAVGSRLVLQIDTRQAGLDPQQQVTLLLAYLKSYQHMGTAKVACVAGCSCKTASIDAHNRIRESTTHLFALEVSQAAQCQVAITVASASNSGEHKFKVSGVILQDEAASAAGVKLSGGMWREAKHHSGAD